ncbi:MAG: DUF3303 domain-containing protein [Gemmatimonadetes bacterium]|nr:DUF3303 domain-containing protein [Gemmatimonadota bacterium]
MSHLAMLIERFRDGDPIPVYRRLARSGRRLPEGIEYVASWVTDDLTRCFQVVRYEDEATLESWMSEWSDVVDFEVVPVLTSETAREVIASRL